MIVLLLASHAALSSQPLAGLREDVSADEYKVYSAVIMEDYVKEGIRLAVITDETYKPVADDISGAQVFAELAEPLQLPSLAADTCDDFVAQNRKEPQKVGRSFSLGVDYVLVDYGAIKGFFALKLDLEEAWKKFYKKYPRSRGYFRLSRVGFNRARNQALVHTSWMCGHRCGEGKFVLLIKRDDKWEVGGHFTQWVV